MKTIYFTLFKQYWKDEIKEGTKKFDEEKEKEKLVAKGKLGYKWAGQMHEKKVFEKVENFKFVKIWFIIIKHLPNNRLMLKNVLRIHLFVKWIH